MRFSLLVRTAEGRPHPTLRTIYCAKKAKPFLRAMRSIALQCEALLRNAGALRSKAPIKRSFAGALRSKAPSMASPCSESAKLIRYIAKQ